MEERFFNDMSDEQVEARDKKFRDFINPVTAAPAPSAPQIGRDTRPVVPAGEGNRAMRRAAARAKAKA